MRTERNHSIIPAKAGIHHETSEDGPLLSQGHGVLKND